MQFPKTPLFALILVSSVFFPFAATAAPVASPRDLPSGHWAASSVKRVMHENIMGTTADGRFQGDQPVTRYELAVALDRFVRYIEASRKPLHAQTFPAPKTIQPTATAAQRAALTHLVTSGFLPASSSLLKKSGSASVTAKETSAALASVTIALSDRAEAPLKN